MVPLTFMSNLDNIEKFFTQNKPNTDLFFQGLNAIGRGDNAFFNFPIRLPILPLTTPQEFEERWERLEKIVRPADCIMTFDTTSYVSKAIAAIDRGIWSHVAGYAGDGNIFEVTTAGAVERPLRVYRLPRYRIGLYRAEAALYRDPNDPRIEHYRAAWRSQIGRVRYGYMTVAKIGFRNILGIRPRTIPDAETTPNDMARNPQLRLLFTI
jgi:hypothetical protein